ncbi:hypothetical protein [Actinomadura litoris]|uniref:hypothetical protein n=1 Tax=Actinomadura litoris TaxID=2678616 RepID=UPI001FA6E467|nr:hypothetical protein [Actinomadura litoris]
MRDRTARQRRLLALLAGFFGFAVTATLSIVPGSGVAEVIRAGTAAAANSAGNRETAARSAALSRDRRPAAVWQRLVAVDAAHLWRQADAFSHHLRFGSSPDTAQHAVLPPDAAAPDLGTHRADATPTRAAVPKSVHLGSVKARGPPPRTGS